MSDLNIKYVVLCVEQLYKLSRAIKIVLVGRGGQGRSKSAPEWPEFGFGAVQRHPNWSMTHEMNPNWFPQLPLIDLSPFPRSLTRLGVSRELRSKMDAISGADFDLP